MATVTSKGQITIPKDVREALGLQAGAHIEFELQSGGVLLRKQIPPATFQRWRGYLRGKTGSTDVGELLEELRGE